MNLDAKSLYFNDILENMIMKMKFNPDKPVQTRDGRPARVICKDAKGGYPIVALLKHSGVELEQSCWYASDGTLHGNDQEHDDDLVNIPETRWVNVYGYIVTGPWPTKQTADGDDKIVTQKRIACIEFTEGEGLEDGS